MDNKEIRINILKVLYNKGSEMAKGTIKEELDIKYNILDPIIDYLESKKYINVTRGMKGYYTAKITSKGIDYIENNNEEDKPTVTQNFYGNIGNLALGDINTYNTNIYFDALIKAIEESEEIPEEDKRSLIDKIKTIAHDPYVAGIGASAIFEGIKALSMGVKPF